MSLHVVRELGAPGSHGIAPVKPTTDREANGRASASADYLCMEEIYVGTISTVYRGTRGGAPVVVKRLREAQLSRATITQYRRELEIARRLEAIPGVVRIHELTEQQGGLALVMEDGGRSLRELIRARRFELPDALAIAARVAETLGQIHAAKVVHLDVNPSNIVVRGADLEITIIDFGLAFVATRGDVRPGASEGTLQYLAPEQTGRVNRAIDHRADLYSLGATMYELLTGAPPFVAADPGELIHAHLARRPTEPHVVDPAIPEVISRIVMKLLAKDPDHRYQSALGVAADLEACRTALRTTGTIGELEIGRSDLRHRLVLPHVLFGREHALAELLAGLDAVAAGERRLQLVGGYAGIGKTCLIEELRRPVAARGGYFAGGKFAQLRNDIPYSALAAALRQVVAMLLSEGPEAAAQWRQQIGAALGGDAGLVIELVPELGLLLDVKPQTSDGARDVSRLVPRLLIKLIATLATPAHPLVLFLDDLQWADPASLRMVESLIKADAVRSLYLIGSFRDNEVGAAHPMMVLAHALALHGARVSTIVLEPLTLASVVRLLAEALGRPADEVTALAEVVVDKTGGNPFFVRAFVDALADAELVEFDGAARRWRWDIAAIRGRTVTDNVVELLIEKIDRLGGRGRDTLIIAACLGSEFDLQTLATATEIGLGELAGDLAPVIEAGLVLIGDALGATDAYQFAHDRVQQAAYALIPEAERSGVHQRIGRRLLAAMPAAARDARLFELLYHLNFGMDGPRRTEPVPNLVEMNLAAGTKARARAAHATALRYFELAIALLHDRHGSPARAWKAQHGLALELHDAATDAAFLVGDVPRMEVLASTIRERATSVEQTVKSVRVRCGALHAQLRLEEALDLHIATLAALGVSIPRKPGRLRMWRSIAATLVRLRGRSGASLAALPRMTDPHWRLVMDVMGDATLTAYLASQELFVILSLTMVDLSLRHGNCEISIRGYGALAIVLCSAVGDFERGNEIADGMEMMMAAAPGTGAHRYGLASCVRPWRHHIRDGLPMYLQGLRDSVEAGNHKIASHNAFLYCSASYVAGRDLPELAGEIAAYAQAIRRMNETNGLRYLARMQQSVSNLMTGGDRPWLLIGDGFNERAELAARETPTNRSHFVAIYIEKMLLAVVFRQPGLGLTYRREASRRLDAIPGYFLVPSYYFYGALLELAACDGAPEPIHRALMRSAQRSLDKLRKFARAAPMNYLHCVRLVEAELHRIAGRQGDALDAYQQAIELAHANKYRHHEALANELAGRFHLRQGRRPPGQLYLVSARALYLRWGATAKVKQLDGEFPDLAEDRVRPTSLAATSTRDLGHLLDLGSVIKASQRLSSEVVLPKLVAELMSLVAENAGAERGFLISNPGAGWTVNAAYGVDGAAAAAQAFPIALEQCDELAASMVRYVLRTKEPLVLADATHKGPFVSDAYVRRRQPRSVLVVPMLRQGEASGVLYLENNLSTGAFTPERVEVLSLLASQAAISIENAHLYDHLERKVAERTATLEQLQQVAVARYAGLAETATGVLHDVNNILNSVVVSCSELTRGLQSSRVGSLSKATALLQQHGDDLGTYLTSDPKGKELPRFMTLIAKQIETENAHALDEVAELRKRVSMIGEVIAAQQSSATGGPRFEKVELSKIVDDVLQILALADDRQPIQVIKHYDSIGRVVVHRTKLAHVVVNLVKNAVEAVAQRPESDRRIEIRIGVDPAGQPYLSIRDNGMGIAPENRDRLFGHGFTTKVTGHGFGLHACAGSMAEMNGSISAESPGLGHGATFTLAFAAQPRTGA